MSASIVSALNGAVATEARKASAPVYTPRTILALDVAGALSRRIVSVSATADGGNISGRHLHMTAADYAAAVGKVSADSVAGALVYATVHFFNGSKGLADLADPKDGKNRKILPAWLATAVHATFDGMKPRNGCTEAELREWSNLLWGKIKGMEKPAAASPAAPKAVPSPVTVTTPAVPRRSAIIGKAADYAALLAGAFTREAEAGALDSAFLQAGREEAQRGAKLASFAALAAPETAPAPVLVAPALSNDYRADAHNFVMLMGEEKARKFLDALMAELSPVLAETPVKSRKPRVVKKAA